MTQPTLDFAVTAPTVYELHRQEVAAELDEEHDRRDSSKARILSRLRQGPALNTELNAIAFRFGARLLELKREGYAWTKEHQGAGVWRYMLTGERR